MAYPYYANSQYYMQNMQDLQNMREQYRKLEDISEMATN